MVLYSGKLYFRLLKGLLKGSLRNENCYFMAKHSEKLFWKALSVCEQFTMTEKVIFNTVGQKIACKMSLYYLPSTQ